MNIRKLEIKDAPFMLEWMNDDNVTKYLRTDFKKKSLEDCHNFILDANKKDEINWAVVSNNDEYMGTVSLKMITKTDAEFAISIRSCAMGKGYSSYAMNYALQYGIEELKLEYIYWCVNPENKRAIRFYEKNGFQRVEFEFYLNNHYSDIERNTLIWFKYKK